MGMKTKIEARIGKLIAQLVREVSDAQGVLVIAGACFYWGARILVEVKKDEARILDVCRLAYRAAVTDMGGVPGVKNPMFDPDTTMDEIVRLLDSFETSAYGASPLDVSVNLGRLIGYVREMDEWLKEGGRLPKRWSR
jgi:hypothetical protein